MYWSSTVKGENGSAETEENNVISIRRLCRSHRPNVVFERTEASGIGEVLGCDVEKDRDHEL